MARKAPAAALKCGRGVGAGLYERHVRSIEQVGGTDEFKQMNRALLRLDRFWNDTIADRM